MNNTVWEQRGGCWNSRCWPTCCHKREWL